MEKVVHINILMARLRVNSSKPPLTMLLSVGYLKPLANWQKQFPFLECPKWLNGQCTLGNWTTLHRAFKCKYFPGYLRLYVTKILQAQYLWRLLVWWLIVGNQRFFHLEKSSFSAMNFSLSRRVDSGRFCAVVQQGHKKVTCLSNSLRSSSPSTDSKQDSIKSNNQWMISCGNTTTLIFYHFSEDVLNIRKP